jgi:hypothetical protein
MGFTGFLQENSSLEQSPSSEANSQSIDEEISHILWNPKVVYCVYKNPSPAPILSHMKSFHTPLFYLIFFKNMDGKLLDYSINPSKPEFIQVRKVMLSLGFN